MWFFWLVNKGAALAVVYCLVEFIDEPTGENLLRLLLVVVFMGFTLVFNHFEREALKNGGKLYAGVNHEKRD
ncbi:hypothetical protein G3C70_004690 [Salmonella enterica]|nr:hypothetical protein [Salmonella enterica]